MDTARDRVVDEALSLPTEARLRLVDKLIAGLNPPSDKEVDRIWAQEAEKRVSEIDRGKAKIVPGEKVFARIRTKYER